MFERATSIAAFVAMFFLMGMLYVMPDDNCPSANVPEIVWFTFAVWVGITAVKGGWAIWEAMSED